MDLHNHHPFKGIMLVSDMDGTLLDSCSRVSDGNLRAIIRFVEGGGMFTVATGRMVKAVEPYLPVLPLNLPAIVYNGAAIYDFGRKELLWRNCLPYDLVNVARGILKCFPGIGLEVFHGEDLYLPAENDVTYRHMLREGFKPRYCSLDEIPQPWFKILIASSPEELLTVEEFLKGRKEEFHAVYSEPKFLELLNKDASKGHALKRLAGMAGFTLDSVIAVGDNRNDIEMLKVAGTGVAVANAHKELEKIADVVCCHHDRDAIAEVIGMLEDGTLKSGAESSSQYPVVSIQ